MAGKQQEAIHLKGGQLFACCLLLCAAGALCRLAPALATSPPDPLDPAGEMPPKIFDEDYLCLMDVTVHVCFDMMRKDQSTEVTIYGERCCKVLARKCKPFFKDYFTKCKENDKDDQVVTERLSFSHARKHHSRRTHFERRTDRFW